MQWRTINSDYPVKILIRVFIALILIKSFFAVFNLSYQFVAITNGYYF